MSRRTFTRHDHLSIEDIRVLNAEMAELATLRTEIFEAPVQFVSLNTNQGVTTIATPSYINQIERNIDALAGGAPPVGMQPTRTWLGENRDAPLLSYRDANRWFGSLALIRASLLGRGHDFKTTGSYAAGNCGIRQQIRSG